MNKLFGLFLLALAFLAPTAAHATACFWVGGTGTWDNSAITHWAPSTGGAATGCLTSNAAPAAGDNTTFDGSSGGGVVTVASNAGGIAFGVLTAGAFTGTIDWSVNNPSMSFSSVVFTGIGVRKFLMGSGTFTITGTSGFIFDLGTITNLDGTSVLTAPLTFTATTSNLRSFSGGGKTYGNITVSANTSRGQFRISGSSTINSLSVAAGTPLLLGGGSTTTISTAGSLGTGTASNPILIAPDDTTSGATLSLASGTLSVDFGGLIGITGSGGGTFSATNSYNFGRNTNWTITAPSGGGGGRIIGG